MTLKSDRVLLRGEDLLLPIKPFQTSSTRFIFPTVEELLLGVRGKRMHRGIAKCIYQNTIEESLELLKERFFCKDLFNPFEIYHICKGSVVELERYLDEPDRDVRQRMLFLCRSTQKDVSWENQRFHRDPPELIEGYPLMWKPRFMPQDYRQGYLKFTTVWIRINFAEALFEYTKDPRIRQFMDAHIGCVQYLDSLPDPRDDLVELQYTPVRVNDINSIITERTVYQIRPYPLELIPEDISFNTVYKRVTEADEELDRYVAPIRLRTRMDYTIAWIMRRCKELYEVEKTREVRDALWFYHGCHLDYMFDLWKQSQPPEEDGIASKRTPSESKRTRVGQSIAPAVRRIALFPFSNRCFTSHDLPYILPLLYQIPYWGNLEAPDFFLAKFLQKCLPFAGARRGMIGEIRKFSDAFWLIFRACFYCMLLDMYPEELSGQRKNFDIVRLCKLTDLVTNREKLTESLVRSKFKSPAKENDKGCNIIFTAFRMWILMNTYNQKHFIEGVSHVIDWGEIWKAAEAAAVIRDTIELGSDDPFSVAREALCSGKTVVYRYRKYDVIQMIKEVLADILETRLYRAELALPDRTAHKKELLNLLVRTTRQEWLTPLCLSLMRVSEHSIYLILKLIDTYYNDDAKPKRIQHLVGLIEVSDFEIICWYFHVISILNRISFDVLPQDMVSAIDRAFVNKKYMLYPGREMSKDVFDVFFTICCGKLKTLQGSRKFGHDDVAYNFDNGVHYCSKVTKKHNQDPESIYASEVTRKNARTHRKEFNKIPCKGNPAIQIHLRGYVLILDRTERYLHCPSCGGFHKFEKSGYVGDKYMCQECLPPPRQATCTVCGKDSTDFFRVFDPLSPYGVMDTFQFLYFCSKHRNTAREYSDKVPKDVLLKK
jgi:hypothetical protein